MEGEFAFPSGVAKIVRIDALKGNEFWKRAFAGKTKDHRYYELIEQTLLNQFEHHYVVLEDRVGKIRAIQPIFFVRQNLVEGVPGKIRAIVDLVRKKFPRFLTMRVLMVGCAAGEGQLGAIDPHDEAWLAQTLPPILLSFAKQKRASLVVWKDFSSDYRSAMAALTENGYVRAPSMPMTRLRIDYKSFDEYLGQIGYVSRKSLRRKFRKTERAAKIDMEVVTDITPHIDEIHALYLQVHERSPMKFEVLTKEFFSAIGRTMPERARFFIWRSSGKIIAFSLCLVSGDTIHDECLGLDYGVAFELYLYFYTLRDVISWSIAQGLRCYSSGPLNYDPKLHLGHELAPLDLYVMHTKPLLNPIFQFAVKYLEPTRHDPILKKFPNADRL
ncbi:MAG TPA: GNAT family N-acetyltransferase [Chthoniobacterales bacterium]|jgi:predicted N-acyltransferase|nr:GNAT family N-acetyltransferase [Chthoniobacterales bacterium]